MSLRTIFHSKGRRFRDALAVQDFAAVSSMLEAGFDPQGGSFVALARTGSKENLEIFFRKNAEWRFGPLAVLNHCLEENLPERVDMLLGMGLGFNFDFYQNHPLKNVFTCGADRQKKLEWLEKMTASGIEEIHNKERFLFDAIEHDFPEAADLSWRLGISPHAGSEWPLRLAAKKENREMCLTLIEHGSDLHWAQVMAEVNEEEEAPASIFLTKLKDELQSKENPPAQEKPATIETLSAEIRELRATVAELTQLVKQQQSPVLRLDKPSPEQKP